MAYLSDKQGIKKIFVYTCTPSKNSVVEQKNRTMVEMMRTSQSAQRNLIWQDTHREREREREREERERERERESTSVFEPRVMLEVFPPLTTGKFEYD